MNKLLIYFTLAAAAVAALVQQSSAQILVDATPTPWMVTNSMATNLAVGSISIDCSKQQNIGIQWTFNLSGAGTELQACRLLGIVEPGVRPTDPTLADGFVMAHAANGTTPVVVSTNFNVKGFSRLDVFYFTNGTAGMLTNSIKYSVKPNAP